MKLFAFAIPESAMSRLIVIACVIAVFVTVSNLCARVEDAPQPPAVEENDSQQERGEGFRGRGRFGEQALGYVPLLQVDSVRNELKLEGDQATQVETLTVKIRADFADDIRELLQSLRDADPADRQQFREKMAEIAAKVNEQLSTVLNSEQTSRLRQINLQLGLRRNGAAQALSSADIAAALDLTAEQQEQLREQARAGRRERGREAKTLEEARQEANELLTPEQQEKLTNLLGAEFDLPAAMLEGGGGRGGFGGRRGGGEGRRRLRQRPEMVEEAAPAEAI
jgi:hypothetical protein